MVGSRWQNDGVLTSEDLQAIKRPMQRNLNSLEDQMQENLKLVETRMQKNTRDSLLQFYDEMLAPYFETLESKFGRVDQNFEKIGKKPRKYRA